MTLWWTGLLLGALGAAVADGSRIGAVMWTSKRWPWNEPSERVPLVVALTIRITCASVLAGVVASQHVVGWSDQPIVLFGIGLAAPTVVQNGARIARVMMKALFAEYFRSDGGHDGAP